MKESDIQKTIVQYLKVHKIRHFAPMNETAVMILNAFKIPKNISYKIISFLKAMGLTAGVPDLCLLPGDGQVFFMEVKLPGKGLTRAQPELHEYLNEQGYNVAIVFSLDGAIAALKKWGVVK